jgi:hypothetical protein
VLTAAWLYVRASGRTLREISGEAPHPARVAPPEHSEEPAMQTAAASLSEV